MPATAFPWVVALAAAARAAAESQAAPPTFRASVEVVYVDAFVTRGGRHLPGLRASDFELKDNGVRQEIELVTADSLPLLAVLVFDASGSVAGEKLAALRLAGAAFLDGLRANDEVALLAFSGEIEPLAGPTRDRSLVRRALEDLRAAGATAALDALYAGLTIPSTPARILVVLFTDGVDNVSWLGERQLRAATERSNALIQVVGLRSAEPDRPPTELFSSAAPVAEPEHVRVLREVAELTGGRYWEAESPARIRHAFAAIAEAMSLRYVLSYEPRNVRRTGLHRIDLKLRGRKGDVQARRGYFVGLR